MLIVEKMSEGYGHAHGGAASGHTHGSGHAHGEKQCEDASAPCSHDAASTGTDAAPAPKDDKAKNKSAMLGLMIHAAIDGVALGVSMKTCLCLFACKRPLPVCVYALGMTMKTRLCLFALRGPCLFAFTRPLLLIS